MRYIEAKRIVQANNNFNLIRGCTHGCIYCDSRSTCYQVGDFENIAVKANAVNIMAAELARKRKKVILTTGAMSDPYVHAEKDLCLMQQALQCIAEQHFGISVLTKNSLILRDIALYKSIHKNHKAIVQMTVTCHDNRLASKIEPYASSPSKRFSTLQNFSKEGIYTGIWMTPILPFITDTEKNITSIVSMAADAGVKHILNFGMGTTMRDGSRDYFYTMLDTLFPGLSTQYAKTYGFQYICNSPKAKELQICFFEACESAGILYRHEDIWKQFTKPEPTQQLLFDDFP